MKALTTVLAVLLSVFVVPFHFVVFVLVGVIDIIAHIIAALMSIVTATYERSQRSYRSIWNFIYVRLANPLCEICGGAKRKNRPVTMNENTKQWTHDDCDCAEKIARNIASRNYQTAAMHIAVHRMKRTPIDNDMIVRELRKLQPFKDGFMDVESAMTRVNLFVGSINPLELIKLALELD